MAENNSRFLFALLIGLSVGFLAGFLTATQLDPSSSAGTVLTTAGTASTGGGTKGSTLPEGHPNIDFAKEIQSLEAILRTDPKDFNALSQMGNIQYDMGRFNDAVTWYEKALAVKPDEPGVRTDMGTCLHYVGQHQRAIDEFNKVLAKNPTFPQALHNIGIVLQVGLKDSQGAIAAWEKLLATNPGYQGANQVRENLAKLKAGKPL